jgi:hypothetical protein
MNIFCLSHHLYNMKYTNLLKNLTDKIFFLQYFFILKFTNIYINRHRSLFFLFCLVNIYFAINKKWEKKKLLLLAISEFSDKKIRKTNKLFTFVLTIYCTISLTKLTNYESFFAREEDVQYLSSAF